MKGAFQINQRKEETRRSEPKIGIRLERNSAKMERNVNNSKFPQDGVKFNREFCSVDRGRREIGGPME